MSNENMSIIEAAVNAPAEPPQPAIILDSDYSPNLKPVLFAITSLCLVLSTVATVIRIFVKVRIVRRVHIEDCVLFLSWLVFLSYSIEGLLFFRFCFIVHQRDMQPKDLSIFLKYLYSGSVLYCLLMLVLRVAIAAQLLRIFITPGSRSALFWTTHTLLWLNTFLYAVMLFLALFGCYPVHEAWNPLARAADHCLLSLFRNAPTGSFNVVLELTFFLVPHFRIWRLNMPLKRRIGLTLVFCVGILAIACAAMRLMCSVKLLQNAASTYWAMMRVLCSCLEGLCGFLVLCIPVMPKFWEYIKASLSTFGGSTKGIFSGANTAGRPRAHTSWLQSRAKQDESDHPFSESQEMINIHGKAESDRNSDEEAGSSSTKRTVHISSISSPGNPDPNVITPVLDLSCLSAKANVDH